MRRLRLLASSRSTPECYLRRDDGYRAKYGGSPYLTDDQCTSTGSDGQDPTAHDGCVMKM